MHLNARNHYRINSEGVENTYNTPKTISLPIVETRTPKHRATLEMMMMMINRSSHDIHCASMMTTNPHQTRSQAGQSALSFFTGGSGSSSLSRLLFVDGDGVSAGVGASVGRRRVQLFHGRHDSLQHDPIASQYALLPSSVAMSQPLQISTGCSAFSPGV